MAHHTLRTSSWDALQARLDLFPQGAPPSDLLRRILSLLMDEREAGLVSLLPIRPFTARRAAEAWGMDVAEARPILDRLAERALLLDVVPDDGPTTYVLPPPMAGFFEFSLMRTRGDLDQKLLSELFYQYLNVEDDFIRALFTGGTTQLGRVFVTEPALPPAPTLEVLDYERATEVVKTATHIGVGRCYCRHKMEHVGRACDAPQDICMTFNTTAASLTRHGTARAVDAAECLDLLQQAWDHGLVQFGENVQRQVNFICNCCGCCCEALLAQKRFSAMHPIHTTNWQPEVDEARCNACGLCVKKCPVGALAIGPPTAPRAKPGDVAIVDDSLCLGCGVCTRACARKAMALVPRAARVVTPVDSVHRIVTMAIERGKLQNLLFDNQALTSHRVMAAILGAILKLPPLKQAMASDQFRSRYLGTLIERMG